MHTQGLEGWREVTFWIFLGVADLQKWGGVIKCIMGGVDQDHIYAAGSGTYMMIDHDDDDDDDLSC